jgi:hypothetical protein
MHTVPHALEFTSIAGGAFARSPLAVVPGFT